VPKAGFEPVPPETEYQEILYRAEAALRRSEISSRMLIEANFELGGLVARLLDNSSYGDAAVEKLAGDLSRLRGYAIYPQRLWECARVHRSFKDIKAVWELERRIKTRLTWSFLLRNCTKPPEPERGREFQAYWEMRLNRWEDTMEEVYNVCLNKEKIISAVPEPLRGQIEGFVSKVENPVFSSLQGGRLDKALKKIDCLLNELLQMNMPVDRAARALLLSIKEKIERLIA
jgi:hypothetical protein